MIIGQDGIKRYPVSIGSLYYEYGTTDPLGSVAFIADAATPSEHDDIVEALRDACGEIALTLLHQSGLSIEEVAERCAKRVEDSFGVECQAFVSTYFLEVSYGTIHPFLQGGETCEN